MAFTLPKQQSLGNADLDRRRRRFIVGYTVSIFGTGFTYPLTALFMANVVGASVSQVATYFVAVAIGSMVVSPFAGAIADKSGVRLVGIAGIGLQAAGSFVLASATSVGVAGLGGAILGIGNGLFFGTQTVLFVSIFGRDLIGRIYALQYLIMNVAAAIAGVVGSVLVALLGEAGYRSAFALNGLSFIAYGCVLFMALVPRSAGDPSADRSLDADAHHRKSLLRRALEPFSSAGFLRLAALQFLVAAVGFAQMDAVMPLVFTRRGGLDIVIVGLFLALNGAAVVVLQPRFARLVPRIGEARALTLVVVVWMAAYLIGYVAVEWVDDRAARVALVLVFAVVFAVGEVLLSPALQPLVVRAAPDGKLGAFSSSIATMNSLGLLLGPVATLPLLRAGGGQGLWIAILAGLVVALTLASGLRSRRQTATTRDREPVRST